MRGTKVEIRSRERVSLVSLLVLFITEIPSISRTRSSCSYPILVQKACINYSKAKPHPIYAIHSVLLYSHIFLLCLVEVHNSSLLVRLS